MNLADFSLVLAQGNRSSTWPARFIASQHDRLAYTDVMGPSVAGFAGWLPYLVRSWTTASDKIAFKQHALQHAVATPQASVNIRDASWPFLIKKARSSFGSGIRGPFLRPDSPGLAQALEEGEFCERFIEGRIAKAWYWGSRWCAVEFRKLPVVVGDGNRTVRQLVEAVAAIVTSPDRGAHDWDTLDNLARYGGLDGVDSVPARGQQVLIDFKYASRYEPMQRTNRNVIDRVRDGPLAAQFIQAGEVFASSIEPPSHARSSLFTLDAIVDSSGLAWFLEMNSCPMVQPDMYGVLVQEALATSLGQQQP